MLIFQTLILTSLVTDLETHTHTHTGFYTLKCLTSKWTRRTSFAHVEAHDFVFFTLL